MAAVKRFARRALRALGLELNWLHDVDGRRLELRMAKLRRGDSLSPGAVFETMVDGRTVRFFLSDETDYIQRFHRSGRFYEVEVLERIGRHFRGGTFVDVGANVGNHVLYAGLFLAAERIIAIEPVPDTAVHLAINVAINGLSDLVRIERVGLSSADGTAGFSTPAGNIGGTRLVPDAAGGAIRLVRGDDLLRGERADFIKIDSEGMELQVLEGLRETIARDRPVLLVEVEVEANESGFFSFIESVGYRVAGDPVMEDVCANYFAVPAA